MKKFKIVITDWAEYDNLDREKKIFSKINADLFEYNCKTREEAEKVVCDADAIITQYIKFPKDLIDKLENCKVIARYAMGYDGLDLKAAGEKGIYICNIPSYCVDEVSTHALALLLELNRKVSKYNTWTHSGKWFGMPLNIPSIRKSVIGIIGYGKISKAFIEKIKPLCENIFVCSEHLSEEEARNQGINLKTFDEVIEMSDYVSIHSPLNDKTKHMFNKECFQKMKNTAAIINVARGSIVNEKDLVWALENKEISGAALDVLEKEPIEKDNPLLKFENVIITPHIGWHSLASQDVLQNFPAEEVVRVLTGQKPLSAVNLRYFN